jgi:hypothetical protein
MRLGYVFPIRFIRKLLGFFAGVLSSLESPQRLADDPRCRLALFL